MSLANIFSQSEACVLILKDNTPDSVIHLIFNMLLYIHHYFRNKNTKMNKALFLASRSSQSCEEDGQKGMTKLFERPTIILGHFIVHVEDPVLYPNLIGP